MIDVGQEWSYYYCNCFVVQLRRGVEAFHKDGRLQLLDLFSEQTTCKGERETTTRNGDWFLNNIRYTYIRVHEPCVMHRDVWPTVLRTHICFPVFSNWHRSRTRRPGAREDFKSRIKNSIGFHWALLDRFRIFRHPFIYFRESSNHTYYVPAPYLLQTTHLYRVECEKIIKLYTRENVHVHT